MRPYALAAGFLLALTACAVPETRGGLTETEIAVHDHSLKVVFLDGGHCTGTKVGPAVILLADHCVESEPVAVLIAHTPIDVVSIDHGPGDQARITLATTFPAYAVIGDAPVQGDEIFIFGNPGELTDLLRRGYISGVREDGFILAMLPIWKGDSGSAVFNHRGEIVGVVVGITGNEFFPVAVIQPVKRVEAP